MVLKGIWPMSQALHCEMAKEGVNFEEATEDIASAGSVRNDCL